MFWGCSLELVEGKTLSAMRVPAASFLDPVAVAQRPSVEQTRGAERKRRNMHERRSLEAFEGLRRLRRFFAIARFWKGTGRECCAWLAKIVRLER